MLPTLGLVLVAGACEHTSPFATGSYGARGPLAPGSPSRLTYSQGVDTRPVWLADGSAVLFTEEQLDRSDRDRCLAQIPGSGGSITRYLCYPGNLNGDSLDDLESPAVAGDGRMAFFQTSMLASRGEVGPDHAGLMLGSYGAPFPADTLRAFPYFFTPTGRSVDGASDLHWVGPSALVFLAERWTYPSICVGCTAIDTVRTGLDVERLDLGGVTPVLSLVPNTDQATSVTAGGPDTAYYTIQGDDGAHRRILSTGADSVIFDFGGPVTELAVSGSRLAAIVGAGPTNLTLRVVDLATGLDTIFGRPGSNLHRPALSPDGHHVVAEVAPVDTVFFTEGPPDLWMWTLP